MKQKTKFHKVMSEFKTGTLRSSSGELVADRKQAIAIAMSESGMSKSKGGNMDKIKGGKSDGMRCKDIAKMHKVPLSQIMKEFKLGRKVETEHTDNPELRDEIVRDHLYDNPAYYSEGRDKGLFDELKKSVETRMEKSKYLSRKKGPDGKWKYVYKLNKDRGGKDVAVSSGKNQKQETRILNQALKSESPIVRVFAARMKEQSKNQGVSLSETKTYPSHRFRDKEEEKLGNALYNINILNKMKSEVVREVKKDSGIAKLSDFKYIHGNRIIYEAKPTGNGKVELSVVFDPNLISDGNTTPRKLVVSDKIDTKKGYVNLKNKGFYLGVVTKKDFERGSRLGNMIDHTHYQYLDPLLNKEIK